MTKKLTYRIYGCGGFGVNAALAANIPSKLAGYPDASVVCVDTSDSNIPSNSTDIETYLIPGIKGAGKNRKMAHEVSESHVDKILLKYPPSNTNVIVFSLAGGTGSVLGPLLMSELIKRGENAIAFVVISTASQKETENSLNTIGTLQNLSTKVLKTPIIVKFYTNNDVTPRKDVDALVEEDLRYLAILTSGLNVELDHQDVTNLFKFDKVTQVPVQLVDLLIYPTNTETALPTTKAIAVASLLTNSDDAELSLGQAYNTVGYIPEEALNATDHTINPVHFVVTNQLLSGRVAELKEVSDKYTSIVESLKTPPPEFEGGANDGFIF